jgi:hypothetical protein
LSEFYKKLAGNISTADTIIADLKTGLKSDDICRLQRMGIVTSRSTKRIAVNYME